MYIFLDKMNIMPMNGYLQYCDRIMHARIYGALCGLVLSACYDNAGIMMLHPARIYDSNMTQISGCMCAIGAPHAR